MYAVSLCFYVFSPMFSLVWRLSMASGCISFQRRRGCSVTWDSVGQIGALIVWNFPGWYSTLTTPSAWPLATRQQPSIHPSLEPAFDSSFTHFPDWKEEWEPLKNDSVQHFLESFWNGLRCILPSHHFLSLYNWTILDCLYVKEPCLLIPII